ncbi:MAG TPA: hypothetical protein VF552_12905 [Allosphingosinicella sp.]|jgi:hypothetical protein
MTPALLLGLQAAAAAAAPPAFAAPEPPGTLLVPVVFDLAAAARQERGALFPMRCEPRTGNEIVVCGNRGGAPAVDMAALARLFEPRRLVAELGIGGGATARTYVESAPMDRGAVANRVMIGVRLPF